MKNIIFPWLNVGWTQLHAMRARLPHAILMCGPSGIGKRELAEYFALALLCENPTAGGEPCGECGACRWFADANHPDYRAVMPEILQPETGQSSEGSDETTVDPGAAKTKSAPSKVIKIGQIRGLDGFFNIGTHRAGRRVVLVYPADALTVDAGNALLKTLEEPPADTLFLLVTSRLNDVLPTVRSRCAKLLLARPEPAPVLAWLKAQGVADPVTALAEAGGAPLAAATADPAADFRDILIAALGGGRAIDPVALAEKCEKAGAANLTAWLTRWVSDLALSKCRQDVRYHPRSAPVIAAAAAKMHTPALHKYYRRLVQMRRVADHPLNSRLFAEELLIDYARLAASGS